MVWPVSGVISDVTVYHWRHVLNHFEHLTSSDNTFLDPPLKFSENTIFIKPQIKNGILDLIWEGGTDNKHI